MIARQRAVAIFSGHFGHFPVWLSRAPGRVNLIGEHTDYNDGFVLPMAIDRSVWIAFTPRKDRLVHLVAADFNNERCQFSLNEVMPSRRPRPSETHQWSNYARGIAWLLQEKGVRLSGFDAAIAGDVPIGAGLASSAALDLAVTLTFQQVSGFAIPPEDLAVLCQESDNKFVGVRCGIMDQFVSILAESEHALLIDCRSLSYESVPLLPHASVVICNSMVHRKLAETDYNARRAECEAGVAALRKWLPQIRALRDVTEADIEAHETEMPENLTKRCRHVVTENRRVIDAVSALRSGKTTVVGHLMEESHESLRADYEVCSAELDALVSSAKRAPGYIGARLTGAGFGGCTVNLVESDRTHAFCEHVAHDYAKITGRKTETYVCTAAAGASVEKAS